MAERGWCWSCVVWCAVWCAAAGEAPAPVAVPAAFELDSTVLLNDVARADKEVGYKIRATLHIAPLWSHRHTDYFLQFQLHSPKLYLRGKHVHADFMPYDSVWDSYSHTSFYALWSDGLIKKAFLDPNELPDVLNYKKSLLSLFQFQMSDGEYNETDVSGPCRVLYETVSEQVFRKIKMSCSADSAAPVSSARRVARYTLSAGRAALQALHADELVALGHAQLGVKARAWHTLHNVGAPGPAAPGPAPAPAASLEDALAALPAALRDLPLTLAVDEAEAVADLDEQELGLGAGVAGVAGVAGLAGLAELRELAGGEAAGAGGSGAAAAAALRLLPPLRSANHSTLLQLLQRDDMHDALPALCRLLALAGTRAAHTAAADFLHLHTAEPLLPLAHVYLAALGLAPAAHAHAHAHAVRDLLRLADQSRAPALHDAALLAAAAAAAHDRGELAGAVRDSLVRGLARCQDEPCRAVRLHALGNLRRADTAELLLQHACAGRGAGPAALAALDALAELPAAALTFERLDRLHELALDERAPLELRAAALDLAVRRRAELPAPLARLAHALHERGPHELRRVLWQRMAARAPHHAALQALPGLLAPVLRGWDAAAHGGTSSVLQREAGWAAGGWRVGLDSVTLARGGLLRRATVRLRAHHPAHDTFDALAVEVWTHGLEAFGGSGGDVTETTRDDAPAEEVGGGLALAVGGMRMRDISLFKGQAELLGHVWAGTASSPTAVLRALRPLDERRGAVPLQAGVLLHGSWRAALALALDAQAQVSLWWRSARGELELRAGAAAEASAGLRTAWGRLAASARLAASPRLRIAADLDFYEAVALCVRVRTDDHWLQRNVTLSSELGQRRRRLRVRRARRSSVAAPGRTLALGRPNDATCRTLRAADDAAPDPEPA